MPIIYTPINGIGLGHVARGIRVCQTLSQLGYPASIFSVGCYPEFFRSTIPGTSLARLIKTDPLHVMRRVESYVLLSKPYLIFDDTYPLILEFSRRIHRALVVRPTEFTFLHTLRTEYSNMYSHFLLADAPESPTWPYSAAETAEITEWKDWSFIGPVFRTPAEQGITEVKKRHLFREGQAIYVFSMGGGGCHNDGNNDRKHFIEESLAIGHELREADSSCRLMFIRGPLFPREKQLPNIFEDIAEEPLMPELLSIATGAVIRPGFNTLWECIYSGTPFVGVEGTTYEEPVSQRLTALISAGIGMQRNVILWKDKQWVNDYRLRCAHLAARWTGVPCEKTLREVVRSSFNATQPAATFIKKSVARNIIVDASLRRLFARLRSSTEPKHLFFRIDDVVEVDDALAWVLNQCVIRKIPTSLEVIPYLSNLTDTILDRWDPERLILVSQHGYAHIPDISDDGHVGEYINDPSPISKHVKNAIQIGYSSLKQRFPRRFCGGFSPPYDGLPSWLPEIWSSVGGQYLSTMHASSVEGLPVINAEIDLWHWGTNRPRPLEALLLDIEQQMHRRNNIGVVVHPRLLEETEAQNILFNLINLLASSEFFNWSLRALVQVPSRMQKNHFRCTCG